MKSSKNASSAHFPYLRDKEGSQWRQLGPEWKPQHRSGKNSLELATQTCCEACEPCDLLWKLTFKGILKGIVMVKNPNAPYMPIIRAGLLGSV